MPNPVVIVRRAMAHWPIAAVVMVLGVLITTQVIRLRKPLYKSETVVFYRQGVLKGDGPSSDAMRTLGTKLKEMLLSQSNLKKIIDEYHLYTDIVDKRGYTEAVDQFRKQIDFKARSNDTFAISFLGSSRDEAQDVTTRLAETIVEENAKSRQTRAKEQTEFVVAEKKRVDGELDRSEKELAQFMADHPEYATENGKAGAAVRAEQKKVGAAAAGEAQAARRRALALGGRPTSLGTGLSPSGPLSGPPVDPLLLADKTRAANDLAAARKDLADKSLRFTEQHPDVRNATQRVAAAEAAFQRAEEAIVAAQPPPPPPVPVQVDPSAKPLAKPLAPKPQGGVAGAEEPKPKPAAKTSDGQLVALETEWLQKDREVSKWKQQQSELEKQLFQAEMNESSEVGGYAATIAILDPAFKPAGPSGTPNRTIIIAGFLASLMAGIALAAARGIFLDDRLFDASEIDGLGLVPVLGVVPKQKVVKTKTRGSRA